MYSVELLTSYHGLELLNLSSVGFLMVLWHEYPEKETRLYYIKKERKKKKTNRQTIFIQTVIIPVIIIFKMPILLNLHNTTLKSCNAGNNEQVYVSTFDNATIAFVHASHSISLINSQPNRRNWPKRFDLTKIHLVLISTYCLNSRFHMIIRCGTLPLGL